MNDLFDKDNNVLGNNKEGSYNFDALSDDDFPMAYLDIHSDISNEEFNYLFGSRKRKGKSSAGGKTWGTAAEAGRFASKVGKYIDQARAYLSATIGQDTAKVKEKRTKDFAQMLIRAKENQKSLEKSVVDFTDASNGVGWKDATKRAKGKANYDNIVHIWAKAKQDWKWRHDWVTESVIDKAGQGVKTVGLAPIREAYLTMIRLNFFNFATALKMTQQRNPEGYATQRLHFKEKGGNRTLFDKAVNKGYKKKPMFAKRMDITELGFDGSVYADAGISEDTAMAAQNVAVGLQKAQAVSAAVNSVKYDKGDGKTLILPAGVGGAAALALSAFASPAVVAVATPAGAFLDVAMGSVTALKIPLKGKERNSDKPSSDSNIKDIQSVPVADIKKTEWIANVPNGVTFTVGSVLFLGLVGGALALGGAFKKKS